MAFRPLRPAITTKQAGCRAASVLPPGVVRVPAPPTLPSLPASPKRPSSARIASRPWRAMPPALSKRMPDGIRLFIAGRPFPYFPSYSSGRKQAREKNSVPLHSQHPPPLRSYDMPYSKQPPDSDGDFRPDLKKVFSGMGRAREGKGQFLQKTPLPLSSFPRSTVPPQQKSGAVTCTRFYRKNKGTWMCYFFSPLCLRLWPCCMK